MNKGFTLIELLVAIAIIGILSSLALANFNSAQARARDAQRKNDLKIVRDALEQYKLDYGSYPTAESTAAQNAPLNSPQHVTQFTNLNTTLINRRYMSTTVRDPRNTPPFQYRYATTDTSNTAYTLETCLENTNDPARFSIVRAPCATPNSVNYRVFNP